MENECTINNNDYPTREIKNLDLYNLTRRVDNLEYQLHVLQTKDIEPGVAYRNGQKDVLRRFKNETYKMDGIADDETICKLHTALLYVIHKIENEICQGGESNG